MIHINFKFYNYGKTKNVKNTKKTKSKCKCASKGKLFEKACRSQKGKQQKTCDQRKVGSTRQKDFKCDQRIEKVRSKNNNLKIIENEDEN